MNKLTAFIDTLNREVENHSIYVWAASGQLCKDINEKWIREHESRNENGKHADDAVAAWLDVMSSPYADVARAFDCSGYVSYCLMQADALDKRRDCDGLYSKCDTTDDLRDGTLLFRVNKDDPNDETHVGVYIGGLQYHAKGRCFGVVCESYAPNFWAKKGWFKSLPKPEPEPKPTPSVIIRVKGSVRVREGNGVLSKRIATARNCDLPYLGQAPEKPYWYMTQIDGKDGYITSNPRYTELVEVYG